MAVKDIYKLVIAGGTKEQEEFLRTPTKPVTKIDDHILSVIQDLKDTLWASDICVGLSANQIGEDVAICIINVNKSEGDEDIILINPKVIVTSGKKRRNNESCMSVPGFYGKVERREKVKIEFNDIQLNECEGKFEGFISRAVQHEIDHLNGEVYVDKLLPESKLEKWEDKLNNEEGQND